MGDQHMTRVTRFRARFTHAFSVVQTASGAFKPRLSHVRWTMQIVCACGIVRDADTNKELRSNQG
jgi:hypothetical protein